MSVDLIADQHVEDIFDVDVHEISTISPDGGPQLKVASEHTCTFTSMICCCP